ncbi:MAG: nicotinate-nucleotide adenylyltransferase [Pseudomonadota bacterium]
MALRAASSQRVGLLGGSFNPAHAGHREISVYALKHLRLDAVWWLVSPANPLKDPEEYAPLPVRMSTARAIASHERIVVSNYEQRMGLQYTADTLTSITSDYGSMRFVWLMGADSLRDFHRWRDWRTIAQTLPIAIFNRPGYHSDALESEAAKTLADFRRDEIEGPNLADLEPPAWIFFQEPDNSLSSTEIRNAPSHRH